MKKVKSVLLMLVVCALMFNSCKKSDSPQAAAQNISLKFNGTSYSSSAPVAHYYASNISMSVITIVAGFNNNTSAITLTIRYNPMVGAYNLGGNSDIIAGFATGSNLQDSYLDTAGTLIITNLTSTTITGTFQFTGTDLSNITGTVTEGQFSANLITQ
jgi:hypothetical protein